MRKFQAVVVGDMAPVVTVMASDVADPLALVVTTPGTEVFVPGVVVLLLDPQAARPATMLREMDAGTMKRLSMVYYSFDWVILSGTQSGRIPYIWSYWLATKPSSVSDVEPVVIRIATRAPLPQNRFAQTRVRVRVFN
jgi:hypothetical protein